jgi:hypothetical protein
VRGNGLSAQEYVAVADLDPGTADVLLVALRDRGVAAYAAESPDPSSPEEGSIDRLYVDVAAVEQAKALIRGQLAGQQDDPLAGATDDVFDRLDGFDVFDPAEADGPDAGGADDRAGAEPALDFDAEFASIVAAYHRPPPGQPQTWPAQEDLPQPPPSATFGRRRDDVVEQGPPRRRHADHRTDEDRTDQARSGEQPAAADAAGPGQAGDPSGATVGWDDVLRPEAGSTDAHGTAGADGTADADEEEGYTPPPPPPLPHPDTAARFAWAGVLGGPALLFLAVLLGWHLEDWLMLLAAVAFLGGFVTLVARLGERGDDDDDGAVV